MEWNPSFVILKKLVELIKDPRPPPPRPFERPGLSTNPGSATEATVQYSFYINVCLFNFLMPQISLQFFRYAQLILNVLF